MINRGVSGEEHARRISVLYDTALLINASDDYDAIIAGAARHLRALIPVDHAWLLTIHDGELRISARHVEGKDGSADPVFNPDLLRKIADQEANSWFDDRDTLAPLLAGGRFPDDLASLLVCPLQRGDVPEGYLILGSRDRAAYTREDAMLLFLLGLQLATVLRNIRLRSDLLDSNSRLNLIFENIEEGLLLLDTEGVIQSYNSPVTGHFFRDTTPAIGTRFPEFLLSLKERFRVGRWVSQIRKLTTIHDESFPLSFELVTGGEKDGRETIEDAFFVEILLIRKEERRIGMLVLLRDIGELKKADELRRDLTSMLVHDLRSPLGIINWNMEMILDGVTGEVTERQEKLLRGSIDNSRELLNMVDSLLDIDRLETGALILDIEMVDPVLLVSDLIGHMDILSRQMGLCFNLENDPDMPPLQADRMMLRRILFNLLFNASKYSPPQSAIDVGIEFEREADQFLFSVRDRGPGVPAKYRNLIFDKYVQVQARSRGEVKSKGLGLTFCKLAVEAHNGSIWVESEEGEGSVFRFTVPREYVETPP